MKWSSDCQQFMARKSFGEWSGYKHRSPRKHGDKEVEPLVVWVAACLAYRCSELGFRAYGNSNRIRWLEGDARDLLFLLGDGVTLLTVNVACSSVFARINVSIRPLSPDDDVKVMKFTYKTMPETVS